MLMTKNIFQHISFKLWTLSRTKSCAALISILYLFQFARQFSRDEPLTFDWVCRHVSWPLAPPKNIKDLVHLEAVHDVLDLYLWLR